MEVKLNIDSANLGETVVELFKNLSPEKKEALAVDVLQKWFNEPYDVEYKAFEAKTKQEALTYFQNQGDSWDKREYGTIEKVQYSPRYRDAMAKFRSSKQIMVEETVKQLVETYRTQITEIIKTDPQIQEMMQLTIEGVKKDFPAFVHDAMMYWFTNNLQTAITTSNIALAQSRNVEEAMKQISHKVLGY